jgi:hypothetical protein
VRRLALASLLLLSACTGVSGDRASAEGGGDDDGDDSGGGLGSPDATECQLAADCVAAASTCCECPAFAVASSSGYEEACSEVNCDLPADCAAVEPACNAGRCELICSPLVTELVCDEGFAHDDFGCLLEACAPGPSGEAGECDIHSDCVQVPADCCGCARGGSDTAVPADQVDPHLEGLDCPEQPYCPDVDVCEPDAEARCVLGECQLVAGRPPDDGSGAPSVPCGIADSSPCPDGQVCVLNHPDASDATQMGAGSCQDP